MNPVSVNELTESVNSNLPRDVKSHIAKNILTKEKDSETAKNIFAELINDLSLKTQKEVINATCTLLHTNLGRSPNKISYPGTYTNIEYDLTTLSRGKRNEYLTVLMNNLIGSEDIIFVNNNASSLFVSLKAISKLHNIESVIISRGEIIEIGGSYRLPEIINGERIVAINLAQEVLQANDNWDNKTVTYQEAKQEFDDFISKWAEFVDILSNPGPPSEFANLVTSHEEIKTLVNLVYEDTVELKAGLESSDTGERRSAALESFNSNLDQLTDKISEIVASASS